MSLFIDGIIVEQSDSSRFLGTKLINRLKRTERAWKNIFSKQNYNNKKLQINFYRSRLMWIHPCICMRSLIPSLSSKAYTSHSVILSGWLSPGVYRFSCFLSLCLSISSCVSLHHHHISQSIDRTIVCLYLFFFIVSQKIITSNVSTFLCGINSDMAEEIRVCWSSDTKFSPTFWFLVWSLSWYSKCSVHIWMFMDVYVPSCGLPPLLCTSWYAKKLTWTDEDIQKFC